MAAGLRTEQLPDGLRFQRAGEVVALAAVTAEGANSLIPELALTLAQAREMVDVVAQEQRDEEIRIRVAEAIGANTIRIKGLSSEEVKERLEDEVRQLRLGDERLTEVVRGATAEVDHALGDGSYLRVFRGKELLQDVYRRLGLGERQVSFERFAYDLARACAKKPEVRTLLEGVFEEMDRQVQRGPDPQNT